MKRASFLTIFFLLLGIAFVVALAMRIRSFREEPTATIGGGQPPSAVPSTSLSQAGSGGPLSSTIGTTPTARARIREQLMREPVATAPPPALATPKPQPAPALPKPQPQPQPQPQPKPRVSSMPPSAVQQRSSSQPRASTAPKDPKDPNSDTTPPQLISIEFNPPTVNDGQEAHVIMTAIDDLSGIRGISGTITSPNGKALQGFAGIREGETNRYVGRFIVPKDGEEGVWRINVITMSDNAANSTTLTLAQNTIPANPGLRVVSSSSDSTPPTLRSARMESPAMRVGDPDPLWIEADDDKSGVSLVSAVFQSPNKKARIGAGCTRGDNIWKCELSLPQCIDCGNWQLEQVTLQDKANNLATYRVDNPIVQSVHVNISGESCDSEPPRLHGIALDQTTVTMSGQPTVVTVTLTVSDDVCGVDGASIQYTGPGTGTGGFVPMQRAGDDQTWVGKIPLDPRAPRGRWRINSVQVTDKGHNLRIYYMTDPLLANAIFQVR